MTKSCFDQLLISRSVPTFCRYVLVCSSGRSGWKEVASKDRRDTRVFVMRAFAYYLGATGGRGGSKDRSKKNPQCLRCFWPKVSDAR